MPNPSDYQRTFGFEYEQLNGDPAEDFSLTQEDLNNINSALDYLRDAPDWTTVKLVLSEVRVRIRMLMPKISPPEDN